MILKTFTLQEELLLRIFLSDFLWNSQNLMKTQNTITEVSNSSYCNRFRNNSIEIGLYASCRCKIKYVSNLIEFRSSHLPVLTYKTCLLL